MNRLYSDLITVLSPVTMRSIGVETPLKQRVRDFIDSLPNAMTAVSNTNDPSFLYQILGMLTRNKHDEEKINVANTLDNFFRTNTARCPFNVRYSPNENRFILNQRRPEAGSYDEMNPIMSSIIDYLG